MTRKRFIGLCAIAFSLISLGILAVGQVAYPPKGPKPAKLSPVTFHLEPMTTLQENLSKGIEKANAELALLLAELRQGQMPKQGDIDARFKNTYLAKPILWDEGGKPHEEWFGENGVLAYLGELVKKSTFIHPQGVHVYLEYIPLNSPNFDKYNPGFKNPPLPKTDKEWMAYLENRIDFLINVRTVLAYAPYDDPPIIGNMEAAPHRFVCWPLF